MKLATYLHNNHISCGIVKEEGFVDIPNLTQTQAKYHSVKEVLIRGEQCLADIIACASEIDEIVPANEVKLLAPIPRPGKVIGLAGNYAKHLAEQRKGSETVNSPHETTVLRPFLMPSTVVTGPNTTIPWPCYSEQIDYEIELAVFIGKPAKDVPPSEALDYVAGYSIANDISARSVTFKAGRLERPRDDFFDWLNGKWADGFMPLGPYLVLSDEISDSQNLHMELSVNSHVRQNANTSQMIFTVAEIVSFLSHIMTLEPGDCIATGTPEGVGSATGAFLQPGDKIQCSIEGVGTLCNTLGEPPSQFYKPLEK